MIFKMPETKVTTAEAPVASQQTAIMPNVSGATPASAALSPEDAEKRLAATKRIASSFGEIVALLMRTPEHKHLSLQDLEWLVAPALLHGQFGIAEAVQKDTGTSTPVAAVLWAMVSDEVNQRLLTQTAGPIRLSPSEWRSGTTPWIIVTLGDHKLVGGLLQQLASGPFKDSPPMMRGRNADGKVVAGRLEIGPKAAAA